MTNWKEHFLKNRKTDSAISNVDDIMKVHKEATRIYEQAMMAMGQKSEATHSEVASTEVVMNLVPNPKQRGDLR